MYVSSGKSNNERRVIRNLHTNELKEEKKIVTVG